MNKKLFKLEKSKLYTLGLVVLMLVSSFNLNANTIFRSSQDDSKITLKMGLSTIKSALNELQDRTKYDLFFSDDLEGIDQIVNIDYEAKSVEYILTDLFKSTKLEFEVSGKDIAISYNADKESPKQNKTSKINGTVLDEDGNGLAGVNVVHLEDKLGAVTDMEGRYTMNVYSTDGTLQYTFMGMETVDEPINDRGFIDVSMEQASNSLGDVVLTGYMPINKKTFTGAAVKITSEQISQTANTNILDAISVYEPSFKLDDNILQGSDPNRLPDFSVRGKSSLQADDYRGNPNAPLFILDGFEVPIEKIYDLDINRIESVTILKDASATAIYGSRAANGIVVMETKKPAAGKFNVSVTSNTIINVPDLNSYDLLNASEKLELERKAGYFDHVDYAHGSGGNFQLDQRYIDIDNDVKRGVDTYWLSQPLQTSVDQQISTYIEGGDEFTRYGLDANYKTREGVMKGSRRDIFTIGFSLQYRHKNITFRNYLSVDFGKQTESNYGNYSNYALTNPYYNSKDENGNEKQWLEQRFVGNGLRSVSNPLYNSELSSFNDRNYTNVMDQLTIDWSITSNLRWKSDLSFYSKMSETNDFISPLNTRFESVSKDEKGSYFNEYSNSLNYNVKSTLMFNKVIDKHFVSANVGAEIIENNENFKSFMAVGFPNDKLNNLAFALKYAENSHPEGLDAKLRTVGFYSYLNYSYDDRYFANASYRTDGSSAFGADKRFAPFWSAGIGWNIHKESFLEGSETVNLLKLRGSMGTTGTTQFSPHQSVRTYEYNLDRRYRDLIGSLLLSPGNDDLEWQTSYKRNIGLDLSMFKSRLNITVDVYNDRTENLLTDITLAPSTGFTSYKENLGEVTNKGYEFKVSGTVLRNEKWNVNLFFNASHNKSEISKISSALDSFNEKQDQSTSIHPKTRYKVGQSYTTIWGVKSVGINPADGKEIYIDKDGNYTDKWDSADITSIGDREADLFGFFGFNARFKKWEMNANFRFSAGGDRYNTTLVDRVENADLTMNTDKRVLTDRWQKPGDVVAFKALKDNSVTNVTSRFVQQENYISFSNFSLGYNFEGDWMKKAGFTKLKASILAYDLFYISSIEQERGIQYPFARSISFSLNVNF